MRYAARPVFGVLLAVVMGSHGSAEETKAPWWHFGMSQDASSAPETVAPAPTMKPDSPTVTSGEEESWFAWPTVSKLHWFGSGAESQTASTDPFTTSEPVAARKQPRTRYGKPTHRPRPRNSWAQRPVSTAEVPTVSPWHSMTEATRTAWHKTVDFVTPDESANAPVVADRSHQSWWQKMWGPDEEKKEGPQTVTEWMAQDRLDP